MSGTVMKSCCTATRRLVEQRESGVQEEWAPVQTETTNLENMVLIDGGSFLMGTEDQDQNPEDGEGPIRKIKVNSFYIDKYAVTNRQFAEFIEATNYRTDAEKFGWSFVFYKLISTETEKKVTKVVQQTPWWSVVEGAYWRHPEGPDSNIEDRLNHPVVHISWNDAQAYCHWAGKRLATEAEWEYAARGGLVKKRYPWGDELTPEGEHRCNIWQGKFPEDNTLEDGYLGTAPVDAYEPNGYGLYNMSGNVWEWCENRFSPNFHLFDTKNNPKGPDKGETRVMRGGSYLCHDSYCNRYRVAARTANTPDSSGGNLGFRCVADAK